MLMLTFIKEVMQKAIAYVAYLFLMCTISSTAFGADGERAVELEPIVVTASRIEEPIGQVAGSVTLITEEEIKEKNVRFVLEVLRDVPGLDVVQTGGFGGTTSVYLRGANVGHTMVMIDGVEVRDPTQLYGGFFDFAHLTTDNIERIEIIRGPQSTLYGSDAIGGVINIITRKGAGKPRLHLLAEGGSYETFHESIEFGGGTERINYSLSASRIDSDGFSKATDGAEKDGYKNSSLSSRLGFEPIEAGELSFIFRYTDARTDLDDAAYDDDPNYTFDYESFIFKTEFQQSPTDWWEQKLAFSLLDNERDLRDPADAIDTVEDRTFWYDGGQRKFDWQHNFSIYEFDTVTAGFEYEKEIGKTNSISTREVDSQGYYLQNRLTLGERLLATLGIRLDHHEEFGTDTNYKLSCAYLIERTGTKLKANWGSGFKAPSLYQLYHPTYGDSTLKPEESESYDLGLEQQFLNNKLSFEVTYFHNHFDQLIEYNSSTQKYENIGKARTEGVEAELSFKPIEALDIIADYTYLDTEKKGTGNELARRPRNKFNLSLDYSFMEKGRLNLGLIYFGSRWNNAANTRKLKKYTKIDLSASWALSNDLQIFGRIENLFDRRYQEVSGYNTPEFSCYGGLRMNF